MAFDENHGFRDFRDFLSSVNNSNTAKAWPVAHLPFFGHWDHRWNGKQTTKSAWPK